MTIENSLNPFFIVGAVRSGTTLLRLMLGHHPEICKCEEMEYVTPFIADHSSLPTDMQAYEDFLAVEKGFRLDGYSLVKDQGFEYAVNDFFRQRQSQDKKPIVGAVVHNKFDQLIRIWPNSKFIYLSRDPRDVARSCVQMGWHGTAFGAAEIWMRAHDSWKNLKVGVAQENQLEISFEELVAEPEKTLALVCNFLGVSFAPDMMNIDNDTTYSRPNPKAAKSWRDKDCDEDVRQVEAKIGERLSETRYEPSGLPALTLNDQTLRKIHKQDLMNRMKFRWKRYGFGLWLASVVAARLPFDGLKRSIKLRMQNIDIKHHK